MIYLENIKDKLSSLKNKFIEFMDTLKRSTILAWHKFKINMKDPEKRGKLLSAVFILIVINLFIINIFVTHSYYTDTAGIPFVHAKVGNMFYNNYDYVLLVYLENSDASGNGNGEYHLTSSIPQYGYTYSGYRCSNNSVLTYNEDTRLTNVTLKEKDICSVFFNLKESIDLTVKIMLEDAVGSDHYVVNNIIPAFGYEFSSYECTSGGTLEYDSELHKFKMSSNNKDYCSAYFKKKQEDVIANIYVSNNTNNDSFTQVETIPNNITYSLNTDRSSCVNKQNERKEVNITYQEGYVNVLTDEIVTCDIYLNRNE